MKIRNFAIPSAIDIRPYLREAESCVDALSEEELDRFERELEAKIRDLAGVRPDLRLVRDGAGTNPSKRSRSRTPFYVLGSTMLAAALSLFILHRPETKQDPQFQTKGPGNGEAVVCSLQLVQANSGSAPLSEDAYLVQPKAAVFLRTSCSGPLQLQVLDAQGRWQVREELEADDGYLMKGGELFDLRSLAGQRLRLANAAGYSEEFRFVDGP